MPDLDCESYSFILSASGLRVNTKHETGIKTSLITYQFSNLGSYISQSSVSLHADSNTLSVWHNDASSSHSLCLRSRENKWFAQYVRQLLWCDSRPLSDNLERMC